MSLFAWIVSISIGLFLLRGLIMFIVGIIALILDAKEKNQC